MVNIDNNEKSHLPYFFDRKYFKNTLKFGMWITLS